VATRSNVATIIRFSGHSFIETVYSLPSHAESMCNDGLR